MKYTKVLSITLLIFFLSFGFGYDLIAVEGVGLTVSESINNGLERAMLKNGNIIIYNYESLVSTITERTESVFKRELLSQGMCIIEDYEIIEIQMHNGLYYTKMRVLIGEKKSDYNSETETYYDYPIYVDAAEIARKIIDLYEYPIGMWKIQEIYFEKEEEGEFTNLTVTVYVSFDIERYKKLLEEIDSVIYRVAYNKIIENVICEIGNGRFLTSALFNDMKKPFTIRILKENNSSTVSFHTYLISKSENSGARLWKELSKLSNNNFQLVVQSELLDENGNTIYKFRNKNRTENGVELESFSTGIKITEQVPNTLFITPGIFYIRTGVFVNSLAPLKFCFTGRFENEIAKSIVTANVSLLLRE